MHLQNALLGVGLGDTQTSKQKKEPSVSNDIITKIDTTMIVSILSTPEIKPQQHTKELNALKRKLEEAYDAYQHLEEQNKHKEELIETMVLEGANLTKQLNNKTTELQKRMSSNAT